MPHSPISSGKQLVKILGRLGYRTVRQRGSHIRMTCPSRKPITIPDHKEIGRGLLRKILRDAEISLEEFKKLIH